MNEMNSKTTSDNSNKSIAIVTSTFNTTISRVEFESCFETLSNRGVPKSKILSINVPGALEIPLMLKNLANSKKFDALIALGVIIRGDTFHFEIVAFESASGIARVALDSNIPIANGILTVENKKQAFERAKKKGEECAQVVLDLLKSLKTIKDLCSKSIDCGKNN